MRRTVSIVRASLLWAGMMLPAAGGTDPVDAQVLALQRQGYTHFQITRRLLSTEIEAYAPFGSHRHLELAKDSGDVLESTAQRISGEDYARAVDAIRNFSAEKDRQNRPNGVWGPLMQMLSLPEPPAADISRIAVKGSGGGGGGAAQNDKAGGRDGADQDHDGGGGGGNDSDTDHGDHGSGNGHDD